MFKNNHYDLDHYFKICRAFFAKFNKEPPEKRMVIATLVESISAGLGLYYLTQLNKENVNEKMMKLLHWHGLEELEHRAVAYKVAKYFHNNQHKRLFSLTFPLMFGAFFLILRLLIGQLKSTRQLYEIRSWIPGMGWFLSKRGPLRRGTISRALKYFFRKNFDP